VRARSPPPSRALGCHDLRAKVPSIPRTRRRTRAHPAPSLLRSLPIRLAVMTFQIFVGGQRVNSDFITSTPAWGGQQVRSEPRF